MYPYPFAWKKLVVHSADWRKIKKPVIVDELDHEAHFIAVAGEHDRKLGFSLTLDETMGIAQDIGPHLIHMVLDIFPENSLGGLLIA
jgi:hypothetical protein